MSTIVQRKVSQLPSIESFSGEEYLLAAFNGRSYKVTLNMLVEHFTSSINMSDLEALRQALADLAQVGNVVTQEQLQSALAGIQIPEATIEQIIQRAVQAVPATDLSNYVTQEQLQQSIPVVPDVSGFVTEQQVQEMIPAPVDLSNYVTQQELSEAIPADIDLSGYATNDSVDQKIAQAQLGGGDVDLSSYATKQELENVASAIPSVAGFVTEQQVQEMIPAPADLSGYVTQEELQQAIPAPVDTSNFATVQDIPDVSGFVTSQQVQEMIPAPVDTSEFVTQDQVLELIPAPVDLSNYATKDEIPSTEGFMTLTEVQNAINTVIAETDEFVRVSEQPIGRILWVSGENIAVQDGSMIAPFYTVQQAIDRANADNNPWTIICMPATGNGYTGDVLVEGKSNILVQGWGCQGAHNVQIKGTVTLRGSTTTRIRMRDIGIRPVGDNPTIVFDGTAGRHYFQNVNAEALSGQTGPNIVFKNGEQRWTSFDKCDIGGRVVIENTVAPTLAVYFNGQNHIGCHLEIEGESKVYVRDGGQFGSITHNAGDLEVKYIGSWGGKDGNAIVSTQGERVHLKFLDLQKADGTFLGLVGLEAAKKFAVNELPLG